MTSKALLIKGGFGWIVNVTLWVLEHPQVHTLSTAQQYTTEGWVNKTRDIDFSIPLASCCLRKERDSSDAVEEPIPNKKSAGR